MDLTARMNNLSPPRLVMPSRPMSIVTQDENNNSPTPRAKSASPAMSSSPMMGFTPTGSGVFLFPESPNPNGRRGELHPSEQDHVSESHELKKFDDKNGKSLLITVKAWKTEVNPEKKPAIKRFREWSFQYTELWIIRYLWDVVFIFLGTALGISNLALDMKQDYWIGKIELILLLNSIIEPDFHFFVIGPKMFFPDIIERCDYAVIWLNVCGAIISTFIFPSPYFKVIGMVRTIKGFRHFVFFGLQFINWSRKKFGYRPYLFGTAEMVPVKQQDAKRKKKEIMVKNYEGQDLMIRVDLPAPPADYATLMQSPEPLELKPTGDRELIIRTCYNWRLLYYKFPSSWF